MKYVIDTNIKEPGLCEKCPFVDCDFIAYCRIDDGVIADEEDDRKSNCPLIPVEEIDIENSDGSHTKGYKEIHTSVKTLAEYKEKQMQDSEFRKEYEKVMNELREEIK
jgi:hypothetical protein